MAAGQLAAAQHAALAKPAGSLGRVEELGAQLAAIARVCPPPVPQRPAVVIFAGDHGVLAQGISPWPQEVTAMMIGAFCAGRAAANVIAEVVGAQVVVVDVGVASELPEHPVLRSAKVRSGTADISQGPALTREEAARALLIGAELAAELQRRDGVDLLVGGEMGIGNTTSAACLIAAFTARPAQEITGRGTGIDDDTFQHKLGIVETALARHDPNPRDPLGVLAALGGLEHAALCGLILGAAAARVPLVLDGVSVNAAALAAVAFSPRARDYLIAGHRSVEPGASAALAALRLEPLIDLELRLGEGTGALLALPTVRAAAALLG
ncbi:MAG: nicotinate-nucleotide--dimethylbenzimidazole phosphoribosyltransferase, partial [Actinomycetota bacterium]|nr:nicotinate-nucleotide--dimethylbenzimidazole phosphoribosyltransferase [Actinomycetota bacterium]